MTEMENSQTIPQANIFTDVVIFKLGVFLFTIEQFQHLKIIFKI
jgi:hypothetical protein